MKRFLFISLAGVIVVSIYLMVKRSIPYEEVMQTQRIVIERISVTGPVVWIRDKNSGQAFWFKSYRSFHPKEADSLLGKTVQIHFMKVLTAPFENRVFKLEIDSVVVFDQVVESN